MPIKRLKIDFSFLSQLNPFIALVFIVLLFIIIMYSVALFYRFKYMKEKHIHKERMTILHLNKFNGREGQQDILYNSKGYNGDVINYRFNNNLTNAVNDYYTNEDLTSRRVRKKIRRRN